MIVPSKMSCRTRGVAGSVGKNIGRGQRLHVGKSRAKCVGAALWHFWLNGARLSARIW